MKESVLKILMHELKEIPKHQDFASKHGDAEGYARACGQKVLLERLINKIQMLGTDKGSETKISVVYPIKTGAEKQL